MATLGCRIYVDIMTEEKLSSIQVAISPVIYWSVRSTSRRGGNRVIGVGDKSLFQTATSFTLLENIWCKIQVKINPFTQSYPCFHWRIITFLFVQVSADFRENIAQHKVSSFLEPSFNSGPVRSFAIPCRRPQF